MAIDLKIRIKHVERIEEALDVSAEEEQYVQDILKYALTKRWKPARQIQYVYEKTRHNDRLFTYAMISLGYIWGKLGKGGK